MSDIDRRTFVANATVVALLAGASGVAKGSEVQMTPFSINVSDGSLGDIMQRVAAIRWPKASSDGGWQYGLQAEWLRHLVAYWRDGYDWRGQERLLNGTQQFTTVIDGRSLHFAQLGPKDSGPTTRLPVLALHGWPYSFATMLPLAEKLAEAGHEVIVPSLPGSGFSEPVEPRIRGLRRISQNIAKLMTDVLGHERYIVHGGDHGAVVADWLAIDTRNVAGIHANMIGFRHAGAEFGSGETGVSDASPDEKRFVAEEKAMTERESAYFKLQNTRPETIAYALSDSPVGWAAYMLDKWQKWSDPQQGRFDWLYGRDRLLTETMLFLVSDSVATSMWPYAGFALEPFSLEPGQTIGVPYGYSEFPDPLGASVPRRFAERSRSDIRLWRRHDRGGHFPMLTQTDVLAKDILDFIRAVDG